MRAAEDQEWVLMRPPSHQPENCSQESPVSGSDSFPPSAPVFPIVKGKLYRKTGLQAGLATAWLGSIRQSFLSVSLNFLMREMETRCLLCFALGDVGSPAASLFLRGPPLSTQGSLFTCTPLTHHSFLSAFVPALAVPRGREWVPSIFPGPLLPSTWRSTGQCVEVKAS